MSLFLHFKTPEARVKLTEGDPAPWQSVLDESGHVSDSPCLIHC